VREKRGISHQPSGIREEKRREEKRREEKRREEKKQPPSSVAFGDIFSRKREKGLAAISPLIRSPTATTFSRLAGEGTSANLHECPVPSP
jgi:hypothetical protein